MPKEWKKPKPTEGQRQGCLRREEDDVVDRKALIPHD